MPMEFETDESGRASRGTEMRQADVVLWDLIRAAETYLGAFAGSKRRPATREALVAEIERAKVWLGGHLEKELQRRRAQLLRVKEVTQPRGKACTNQKGGCGNPDCIWCLIGDLE